MLWSCNHKSNPVVGAPLLELLGSELWSCINVYLAAVILQVESRERWMLSDKSVESGDDLFSRGSVHVANFEEPALGVADVEVKRDLVLG